MVLNVSGYSQSVNSLLNHKFSISPDVDAVFLENKLDIISYDTNENYSSKIEYESVNGLNYVNIINKIELPYGIILDVGRYLVLFNDSITLFYSGDKTTPKLICSQSKAMWGPSNRFHFFTSSNLIENKYHYDTSFFNQFSIGAPWVPDLKNDSNPTITMRIDDEQVFGNVYLLLLNGFISYRKPYLYEQNRRVKRIKVNSGNDIIEIFELKDTPEPQMISVKIPNKEIQIEILDYYQGSKYNDVCITSINPALF